MILSRTASRLRSSPLRRERRGGFSLVGAFLFLTALGLAIAIALGEVRKFQHRAQRDQFVTDLTQLAGVFEAYRAEKGEWPAGTHAELRTPRGMESVLASTPWVTRQPFGGAYDWIPPQLPPPVLPPPPPDPNAPARLAEAEAPKTPAKATVRHGLIAVTAFSPGHALTLTEDDLRYIDAKLDDGDLATGRFRAGFNRWPTYIVNPRP